uniref:Olfactory receptor n=1 Tax=Bos indicus x Bos taurus TaxID=30522 RepID=A0A4W2EUI7_BOBOX
MTNETMVTEFILKGFSDVPELRLISTIFFLFIYLFALLGNISIIAAVSRDSRLHIPMYFFLKNLSFLDMCYTTVIVPKALINSLMGSEVISFWECVAQLFLFVTLCASECFLLTSMAYDRCLAIYKPLLYGVIMSRKLCTELVMVAWLSGAFYAIFHTINTFSLQFCGPNVIDHFFCDMLVLSCSSTYVAEMLILVEGGILGISSFLVTFISYFYIVSAILKIQSTGGKHKAFSTCASHLLVVCLFGGTTVFTYVRPYSSQHFPARDRLISMLYGIITPMLNPMIYSLRNIEVKGALRRVLCHRVYSLQV